MPRKAPQKANRLTPRDRAVLEQVVRYGLTTNEVVCKIVLRGQHPSAAAKVTARLASRSYLERLPLFSPRVCFVPGARLAHEYGLPAKRSHAHAHAHALGPQSLPTRYAILAYAHLGRRRLIRLTPAEVSALYPDFPSPWRAVLFCRDANDDHTPTEIVRVDLGGAADHVARKCERGISHQIRRAGFRRRIAAGEFRLTILTTAKAKAAAITQSIDNRTWPKGLAVHLAVIPQLYQLLQGDSDGA